LRNILILLFSAIDLHQNYPYLKQQSKIILGIDPGTVIMGYGIIAVTGQQIRMLEMDVIKLNGKKDMFERLGIINDVIHDLIIRYKPHEIGRAQGVAIAVAISGKLPVAEYSPKKVKQSITGNGNATKEQIWKMLSSIMTLPQTISYFDASDALAVAVCHHFSANAIPVEAGSAKKAARKKSTGWADFIRNNPDRISD
jgi:crossover junction endodeoxyribonuclease RuvC